MGEELAEGPVLTLALPKILENRVEEMQRTRKFGGLRLFETGEDRIVRRRMSLRKGGND